MVLAAACSPSESRQAPSFPHANLLLISVDTLRADALGIYGNQRGTSPGLDAFATTAAVFDNVYAHTPKTAPSHMSLFTGLPPRVHRVGNNRTKWAQRLSPEIPTLAEILADAGFTNIAWTSGGNVTGGLGFDRGFKRYIEHHRHLDASTAPLTKWISMRQPDERWFAFLHTYSVHAPYFPSEPFRSRFVDPDYAGGIPGTMKELRRRFPGKDQPGVHFLETADTNDPRDLDHLRNLYLGEVALTDAGLAAFLAGLEQSGDLDETIVVLTSDHGEQFGEHGAVSHNQLWEEELHVPLLVRLPDGMGAGTRLPGRIGHTDFLPSILELLGLDWPEEQVTTGRSWASWLSAPPSGGAAEDRPQLAEHRSHSDGDLDFMSYRRGTWSLSRSAKGRSRLYDVREEPGELLDVAGSNADVVEDLLAAVAAESRMLDALGDRFAAGGLMEVDDALRAELEALGYLGADG